MPRMTGFETGCHWSKCEAYANETALAVVIGMEDNFWFRSLFLSLCKVVISLVHISLSSNKSKATMGTQKGSNAKKATDSAARKRKLSTKVKIAGPVSRPKWPCRIAKQWEEWEDKIVLEFRKEGKTYTQIMQHLPRRSYHACRTRCSALKVGSQKARTQRGDALISSVRKQQYPVKAWEDWEDKIILGLRKEGKTHAQISQHLSHRSHNACRIRFWHLNGRTHVERTGIKRQKGSKAHC